MGVPSSFLSSMMSTKVTVFFLALVDLDNCALDSPVSVFALNRSGVVAAHARAEVRIPLAVLSG